MKEFGNWFKLHNIKILQGVKDFGMIDR